MIVRSKTADNMLSQRIRQMTFLAFLSMMACRVRRGCRSAVKPTRPGCLMGEAEMIQQQDNEGRP
jgi:hypothetical protein